MSLSSAGVSGSRNSSCAMEQAQIMSIYLPPPMQASVATRAGSNSAAVAEVALPVHSELREGGSANAGGRNNIHGGDTGK